MMLEATNQMTLETASFAEGAIEVMFLQQQGLDHLQQHLSELRRLETLQLGLPNSSGKRNQRSASQSTTFACVTRRRRLSRTDCDRKRAKVFAHGLPMTAPQTRTRTPYPPPPHRKSSLTKGQMETKVSFVLLSMSRRSKVLPAIEP
jgi:hypothetical protein